jgi:hypothetical protein
MRCPRCEGERIQRDYDNANAVARLAGMHKLLCNTCGHVFHGFDPLRKLARAPAKRDPKSKARRRSPRFHTHLPTSISLIYGTPKGGKVSYSDPSHGHCESINEFGVRLSLVGTRFSEQQLTRVGSLLLVRIHLPEVSIEAVVSVLNHERVGDGNKSKWLLGGKLHQISDEDKANLLAYLKKRVQNQPLEISD